MKNINTAKKKFGQNFLIKNELIEKILSKKFIEGKNILEIGPGNLALTKGIIKFHPKKYIGVEIDQDFKKKISDKDIIKKIIFHDALKINEQSLFINKNFSIISNLPFNISSQLLFKWCDIQNNHKLIDSMTLMFQKELGERILAKKDTKKYGGISIITQAFFNVKKKIIVEKENFSPIPKVDAIVIDFIPLKENKINKNDFNKLKKITSFFFNERRKINKKKIEKLFGKEKISKYKLEKLFYLRPENLDKNIYYDFVKII